MATPACMHLARTFFDEPTRRSLSRTSASWTPPLLELVASLADSLPFRTATTTTTSAGWACFPLFFPFRIHSFLSFPLLFGLQIISPAFLCVPHLPWYMGPRLDNVLQPRNFHYLTGGYTRPFLFGFLNV
ncbi:hypothetical protein FRC18_004234 [Serendipita sp. 400]|nr:hypothetical protein FRC18_004234 [Serendipita sp. 400]